MVITVSGGSYYSGDFCGNNIVVVLMNRIIIGDG